VSASPSSHIAKAYYRTLLSDFGVVVGRVPRGR
jgi:hypothetical protein